MSSENLETEALICMEAGPFSVTDKEYLEFTTDPQDYVSGRLYWWREGDGYVRRDGEPNPEILRSNYDRQRLIDLIHSVTTLTRACQQLGNQEYGVRAAEYIRIWFVDPNCRMNPNLEYAAVTPGMKKVHGGGIIHAYNFFFMLDSVEILIDEGFIDTTTTRALKRWFRKLVSWLTWSRQGRMEGKRSNNHGTSYDVQVIRYLLFCGRRMRARRLLLRCRKTRIHSQISSDGRQPYEENRTKSLFYHWYNLTKLIHLCELGARTDVGLIQDGDKIKVAIEYLLPYFEDQESWPLEQIAKVAQADAAIPVQVGASVFRLEACHEIIRKYPETFTAPRFRASLQSLGNLIGSRLVDKEQP